MDRVVTLFTSIILSLFTVSAERIYTVCYRTPDITYVYDVDSNVYEVTESGKLIELGDVSIERAPALQYVPADGVVHAANLGYNRYQMSMLSVCVWISNMIEDGYTLECTLSTPARMEGYLYGGDVSYRYIYMRDGTARIYPSEADTMGTSIPYINGG